MSESSLPQAKRESNQARIEQLPLDESVISNMAEDPDFHVSIPEVSQLSDD